LEKKTREWSIAAAEAAAGEKSQEGRVARSLRPRGCRRAPCAHIRGGIRSLVRSTDDSRLRLCVVGRSGRWRLHIPANQVPGTTCSASAEIDEWAASAQPGKHPLFQSPSGDSPYSLE